jgi:hypothetical protein
MSYWEQIGEENRRWRERQANRPRWRRLDWFGYAMSLLAVGIWIGLGHLLLSVEVLP